jgi:flavin-dependent dehydrogenase
LGLRRTALHRLMVDCAEAAGVRLVWNARVTGLTEDGAMAAGRLVRARWTVGADGGQSPVRRWANLDACHRDSRRYGFRRHYRAAANDVMEIHWGGNCQLYITPVGPSEICVALISRDPHLRLDDALPQFPEVARRVAAAGASTLERGGVSASRRLKSVRRGRVALVGDASGSVDAITGEGLCLLFQQAVALAGALAADDLDIYQAAHRRIGRRPEFMSRLMLLMSGASRLRGRAIRAMASDPRLFAHMLAMHVGELSPLAFAIDSLALGLQMLTI